MIGIATLGEMTHERKELFFLPKQCLASLTSGELEAFWGFPPGEAGSIRNVINRLRAGLTAAETALRMLCQESLALQSSLPQF